MEDCIIASSVDNKGYSIDWRDIVRPTILKRDKYKCIECGLSNHTKFTIENNQRVILDDSWLLNKYIERGFKISSIVLSISHECHVKSCINEKHLHSRCQKCHLRYDKHQHLMSRLYNASLHAEKRKRLSQ